MHKPIYLPQELCIKLQSKGLECGSGMWWVSNRGKEPEVWDMTMVSDYDTGGMVTLADAFELHIDILGSRENLVKLFPLNYQLTGTDDEDDMFAEHGADCMDNMFDSSKPHEILDALIDEDFDQAINLIKEAV